jgi:hypothetical protein
MLCNDSREPRDKPQVQSMSDTIQLKSEYEGAEVFSSDPLVAVRNDIISPIECAYLIELAKPHIKRAGVVLDEGFKPE